MASLNTRVIDEERPTLSIDSLDQGGLGLRAWPLEEALPGAGMASAEPGHVLFGKLRRYLAKTAVLEQPCHVSTEVLDLLPKAGIQSRWLCYLLGSQPHVEWAVASSDGTKMPRTSWGKIRDFRAKVPSARVQSRVVDFLDAETAKLDEMLGAKRQTLILARARFKRRASEATMATTTLDINDDRLGTLPPEWDSPRLVRCFASVSYGIGEASRASGAIAVLGMGNIDDHGHVVGEPGGYVDDVAPRLLLQSGDLLFNRTNSRTKVGKLALVEEVPAPTTVASYLVVLRLTAIADPRYLNYALNCEEVLGLARSMALPSIGQANLNPSRYGSIRVALPPVERQVAIASALHEEEQDVCALLGVIERQAALLVERRRALTTAAIMGELEVP